MIWFWDVTLGGGKEEEGGEGRWGWQEEETRSGGISEGEEEAGRESWLNDFMKWWLCRQEIRDKYGIQKKGNNGKDKKKDHDLVEEIKKDYGMSDLEARELQQKMNKVGLAPQIVDSDILDIQESEERDEAKRKVDKKMETRALKKEMKKDLGVDKCKQQ